VEWLSQNWIWLVLAVGAVWLFSRGRHGGSMGGCCAHDMAREGPSGEARAQGADAPRAPITDVTAGQSAVRSPSSHHGSRGGCC
jgi:hypothetical protein